MYIYPYNTHSESVKELKLKWPELVQIKRERSKFKPSIGKTVINWGCSYLPFDIGECNIINDPEFVKSVSNKLKFFKCCEVNQEPISIPDFTTDMNKATLWVREGATVLARTLLDASNGRGIVVVTKEEEMVAAPLYVKYIPKDAEYRVHVIVGPDATYTRVVRKLKRKDVPHNLVRNHDNGYYFSLDTGEVPKCVVDEAVNASNSFVDFGAVDVIYNKHRKKAYVLEVNSAPGIEGGTVDWYVEHLKKFEAPNAV